MKSVYRSIKPYWLYLILIGKKTIEVGKTIPKADDWNKEVFLHCSKDMKSFKRIPEKDREWMRKYIGKCACRFVCDMIGTSSWVLTPQHSKWRDVYNEETCLTNRETYDYSKGDIFYEWNISDLIIYDKPRELSEFATICEGLKPYQCGKCKYYYYESTEDGAYEECCCNNLKPITRAPQSWVYCVEREGAE